MADDPKRRRSRSGRRVEESTQPDMEVPAELLEAGEQMSRSRQSVANLSSQDDGARTMMTRSPAAGRAISRGRGAPPSAPGMERGGAAWTRQVVESGSLELELDQELEPLGEGDGATRVISMSEIGDLQSLRNVGPASMNELAPQARTETHVMAVSMEQIEDSFDSADLEHTTAGGNPYQYINDALDDEVTIGPHSGIKPPQLDFDSVSGQYIEVVDVIEDSIDIVDVVDEEIDYGEVTSVPLASAPPASPAPPSTSPAPMQRTSPPARTPRAGTSSGQLSAVRERRNTPVPRVVEAEAAEEAPRGKSLEALANAVKKKRSQQISNRLGVSRNESPEKPIEDDASKSHQDRIRSIAEKARQRVEQRERGESQQSLSSVQAVAAPSHSGPVDDGTPMSKVARARQLVAEAKALMDEAREMADGLDDVLTAQTDGLVQLDDEDGLPLDASTRREARKIIEMARRIAEVEQNRLPGSTRKTILRLVKELDKQIEDDEGNTARLALQLANRLFETMRRDLRPW